MMTPTAKGRATLALTHSSVTKANELNNDKMQLSAVTDSVL